MPIIPEKLALRQDVKSSIACQFWEQPSHSTRSIDGQVWSLPCEPPALNLTGSSGLSRTQQLIAAQALGVPAFPSYDASAQGLVRRAGAGRAGRGPARRGATARLYFPHAQQQPAVQLLALRQHNKEAQGGRTRSRQGLGQRETGAAGPPLPGPAGLHPPPFPLLPPFKPTHTGAGPRADQAGRQALVGGGGRPAQGAAHVDPRPRVQGQGGCSPALPACLRLRCP